MAHKSTIPAKLNKTEMGNKIILYKKQSELDITRVLLGIRLRLNLLGFSMLGSCSQSFLIHIAYVSTCIFTYFNHFCVQDTINWFA